MISDVAIRYDLLSQEAKNHLLRITVFEALRNCADGDVLDALDAKKDALLAAGAEWKPSPYGDVLPTERVA